MRTVFVNPAFRARGTFTSTRRKRRKKRNPYIMNPRKYNVSHHVSRYRKRKNPDFGGILTDVMYLGAGALGGAALNRVGINHISNFYARNGARVVAAAILARMGDYSSAAVAMAAAGATLAPMLPDIEMQLAAPGITKNPQELAAELADLLEADLSGELDADLAGDEVGDEVGDVEDELSW